jgi:hypothetical protein
MSKITLEGNPDFVIFFDNQHVHRFVKSFSTSGGVDGSYGEATIEMLYTEAFMDIEYLTDVKIFIKNVFSGKYRLVFDGQIHNRHTYIGPDGRSITFTAYDHLFWLQRIPLPILLDIEKQNLDQLIMFNWLSKGINFDRVREFLTMGEMAIAGRNLFETLQEVFNRIDDALTFHAGGSVPDENNIYSWVKISKKIKVISEISKYLRENNVVDFVFQGAILENLYTFLNGIISKLGYEFYQDIDGLIKIKEPFWHEGILKNFVLDPMLVTSMNEQTNWDARCSRVFVVGGVESTIQETNQDQYHYWTPAAVCVGGDKFYTKTGSVFPRGVVPEEPSTTYVKSDPDIHVDASRSALASFALSAVGGPYAKGGNKPHDTGPYVDGEGIDCSGLVFWVFNRAGFTLGDTTAEGYRSKCIPIPLDQVQPGDLGFMNNSYEAYHVGIYCGVIGGKHTWVDAKGKKYGVIKTSSSDKNGRGWHTFGNLVDAIKGGFTGKGMIAVPTGSPATYEPLTQLTDYERKYGISVFETDQPLIRVGVYEPETTQSNADQQLQKYTEYLYHTINSGSVVANMSTIAAPWLRQGFNLWFDPLGLSRIYYISGVRHTGGPKGVYTSLGLIYGRSEKEFTETYQHSSGLNPFTLKRHIGTTEYFVPESDDALAVVNPDKLAGFKEYVKNRHLLCENKGPLPAYNSAFRDWYGKYFIRREVTFFNRWDTEFNLLEIYCIISAGYKKLNREMITGSPTTGGINPMNTGERSISPFAMYAVDYDLEHGVVPQVITDRTNKLGELIVRAEKEIAARYRNVPKNNLLLVK